MHPVQQGNPVNLENVQFRVVTATRPAEGGTDVEGIKHRGLEDEIGNVVSQLINMGYAELVSVQYGVGSRGMDGDIEPVYSALIVARCPDRG